MDQTVTVHYTAQIKDCGTVEVAADISLEFHQLLVWLLSDPAAVDLLQEVRQRRSATE
ncbi:MAG: hypothetical protein ACK443_05765 [Methylococcaceae bacterium]|jgi:hypothetical protein